MFRKLARVMYRRRWVVVGAWVVLFLVAGGLAGQLSSIQSPPNLTIPNSDSKRAADILDKQFGQNDDKTTLVILENPKTTTSSPSFQRAVKAVEKRIRSAGLKIESLDDPIVSGNPQLISKDKHAVAILFASNLSNKDMQNKIPDVRKIVKSPGFTTYVTGTPALNYDQNVGAMQDLAKGEGTVLPLVLIILLVVFGSAVAAALPLLVAILSIVLALALVFIFGHVLDTSVFVENVVTVIGLGLAIDYSLFIVFRFREELAAAQGDVEAAIVRTMETTGRTIFLSGITVAIGLATLLLTGVNFMQGMGLGGVLVPLAALAVAMTLLPAVLSLLGKNINRWRVVPTRFLSTGEAEQGVWHRIASTVMRRPLVSGILVVAVMLAMAYPLTKLNLAAGSLKNSPKSQESIAGFLYMQDHFNTQPNPVQIVVQLNTSPDTFLEPEPLVGLRAFESRVKQDPEVKSVFGPTDVLPSNGIVPSFLVSTIAGKILSNDYRTALILVIPKHDSGTNQNRQLVERLRDSIIPGARNLLQNDTVLVGGRTAAYLDLDLALYAKFPYVIAAVLILAFLFLMFSFESLLLPLKAVLLNLLSVGAAYGLLVLVFQEGVGVGLFGAKAESGMTGWVPVFMFAFLFGLSMDYEVFLLSRIREGWLHTGNNKESVAFGLEKTGRLITSAAAIMVIAFSGFLLGQIVTFKQFGFGLAVSILIDATLVRVILVPSIMELTGKWNWSMPGFLRRIVRKAGLAETGDFLPAPALAFAPAGAAPALPVSASDTVALPRSAAASVLAAQGIQSHGEPYLQLMGGNDDLKYPISRPLGIGRLLANDIVIEHPGASRRHAQIATHDGQTMLRDLNSPNGTMVNGQRITGDHLLREGDKITIGDTSFVFHDGTPPARPRLIWIGGGEQAEYPIQGALTIGRSSSNDIAIDDPSISRRHTQIAVQGDQVIIRDLNSGNGTWVNGQRIAGEHLLREGDTITVGDASFVFHSQVATAPRA